VAIAHLMFGQPVFFASHHARAGAAQLLAEFIATFGLLSVIWACVRLRPAAVAPAVACYIAPACWFTSSTSFANPAVTRWQGLRAIRLRVSVPPTCPASSLPNWWERQLRRGSSDGLCLLPKSRHPSARPRGRKKQMRRLLPGFPQPLLQLHSKEHPAWTRFELF